MMLTGVTDSRETSCLSKLSYVKHTTCYKMSQLYWSLSAVSTDWASF